jgi:hypothetical protein
MPSKLKPIAEVIANPSDPSLRDKKRGSEREKAATRAPPRPPPNKEQ